jgi:HSP20 family molecular chaperone IbpA
MNTVTRWESVKKASKICRTASRVSFTLAEWAPLADITEDDKEYLIKLELPEVKRRT